jgi:phosphate transport system permease protein
MGWLIRLGGLSVILAVFGIFYFVVKEVVPLFQGAEVEHAGESRIPENSAVVGVDEWGEMPFAYDGGAWVTFVDGKGGGNRRLEVPGLAGLRVTSYDYDAFHHRVAIGLEDGRIGSFVVHYERVFQNDGTSHLEPRLELEPWFPLQHGQGAVTALSYGDSGPARVVVARRGDDAGASISILRLGMKRSLMGKGKLSLLEQVDVTEQVGAEVSMVRASPNGSVVLVAGLDGGIRYFLADASGISLRQTFHPFGASRAKQMNFLFGGVSAVVTDATGVQEQWSLFRKSEDGERLFGKTKQFPTLGAGDVLFASSQRNRSFVTGAGDAISVRYSTSGSVRWDGAAGVEAHRLALDAKGGNLFVASRDGQLKRFAVSDHHPEAGWRAFFGPVWYDGGSGPVYQWQSTGGSDDFEPKYSMIPLVFGSLKGTAYALLFSVPVALLAAIFSAAFLPLDVKKVVKPAMEIMASLPSVVLGFLAGLWLAPILENRVPSVLMMVLLLPLSALALGFVWCRLPIGFRNRFAMGSEWWIVGPVLVLVGMAGWALGPAIESWWFIYRDPASGKEIADFRMWWPQATGCSFEQRNSMVLGFMMGFAVIPVIFTIAEDALSNVPKSLTAAAAALGANRWQVVRTILLPVASSGIFSALMIGFGRAVGETMIMVMATGNTPITEWNIFNGIRTLSANIAVELPEAPVGSTHYRALFLGAILLFAMTFVMNTIAEILRQRLRDKNKLV